MDLMNRSYPLRAIQLPPQCVQLVPLLLVRSQDESATCPSTPPVRRRQTRHPEHNRKEILLNDCTSYRVCFLEHFLSRQWGASLITRCCCTCALLVGWLNGVYT